MYEYKVRWEIEIDAETPEQAARFAEAIMSRPLYRPALEVMWVDDRSRIHSKLVDLEDPSFSQRLKTAGLPDYLVQAAKYCNGCQYFGQAEDSNGTWCGMYAERPPIPCNFHSEV